MRNRLAHNYLGVDYRILRTTIQDDLPEILVNMKSDLEEAQEVIKQTQAETTDFERWAH